MRRKRWSELTQRQQAAIAAIAAVQVLLSAATLLDLRRRPSTQVRGSKRLWVAAAFVNFVGPIAYFTLGRRTERR
jgi:bacteriorhodopsin